MNPMQKQKELKRLKRMARLLDGRFRIPFTRIRFGADSIIGLIPGAGDAITAAMAAYIVYEARKLGIRPEVQARMLVNVGIDFLLGATPIIGDVADVFFKANQRNIRLLEEELNRQDGPIIDV